MAISSKYEPLFASIQRDGHAIYDVEQGVSAQTMAQRIRVRANKIRQPVSVQAWNDNTLYVRAA